MTRDSFRRRKWNSSQDELSGGVLQRKPTFGRRRCAYAFRLLLRSLSERIAQVASANSRTRRYRRIRVRSARVENQKDTVRDAASDKQYSCVITL